MIQIKPTTASGLPHSGLSLDLFGSLSFDRPKAKKVVDTIDNGVAVTIWPKTKLGATATKDFLLSPEQFETLNSIAYHQTCFEWLVFNDLERFKCEIDYQPKGKTTINGNPDYQQVSVSFLVVEVL